MPKKLLIVSPDYRPNIGGVATCTYEIAKHLTAHFEVTVLSKQYPGAEAFDREQEFATQRIKTPNDATLAIPSYIKAIREADKTLKPDMVLHMLWYPTAAAHWISRSKTPYYLYAHGVELLESSRTFKKNLRKKLSFLKRKVFRKAQHTIAVSDFTKNLIIKESQLSPEKISIVHNGIDLKKFNSTELALNPIDQQLSLRQQYGIANDDFVFLTVCRLVPNKGIDMALKALAEIKNDFKLKYVICGDGPDRSRLEKLTQQLGLKEKVVFSGPQEEQQIVQWLQLSNAFIMLSRFEPQLPAVEGFGIAFIEAGACAKAVIAGDSGGVRDAVIDQQTGLLVDPSNVTAIKEAMVQLITQPQLCSQLGHQSRARIERDLQWPSIASLVAGHIK